MLLGCRSGRKKVLMECECISCVVCAFVSVDFICVLLMLYFLRYFDYEMCTTVFP